MKSQDERQKHLCEFQKELQFWEAQIQAETQIVFLWGGKGKEHVWEKEGGKLHE